ncbi:MAG: hypothetical protein ACRD8O_07465, partial [Bryobacteraceae bacterium]
MLLLGGIAGTYVECKNLPQRNSALQPSIALALTRPEDSRSAATVTITVLPSGPQIAPAAERAKQQPSQPTGIRGFFARLFGRSNPQPPPERVRTLTLPLRAVKRIPPAVPEDLGRKINGPITVRMRASVSERGRLLRVDPVGRNEGIAARLAELAAQSMRKWQFQPAKIGERYVPATLTIEFLFARAVGGSARP